MTKYGSRDYQNANPIMQGVLVKVVNQDLKKFLKLINVKTILVWDKKDIDTNQLITDKGNVINIRNKDTNEFIRDTNFEFSNGKVWFYKYK